MFAVDVDFDLGPVYVHCNRVPPHRHKLHALWDRYTVTDYSAHSYTGSGFAGCHIRAQSYLRR